MAAARPVVCGGGAFPAQYAPHLHITAAAASTAPGSTGRSAGAGPDRQAGRRRTRSSQTQRGGTSIVPGATTAGRGGAPVGYSVLSANS